MYAVAFFLQWEISSFSIEVEKDLMYYQILYVVLQMIFRVCCTLCCFVGFFIYFNEYFDEKHSIRFYHWVIGVGCLASMGVFFYLQSYYLMHWSALYEAAITICDGKMWELGKSIHQMNENLMRLEKKKLGG
jgi:hypothetical protein